MDASTTTTASYATTGQADPLQLARDAYSSSTSFFDSSIRRDAEAALRQFQSRHPVGSKYLSDTYRSRSHLFRPKTRAAVRKAEAIAAEALFNQLDLISVRPEDDDSVVQHVAAKLKKSLLQYRLKKSIKWFQLCMGAYQDAQVVGVVISHQYWEYNAKKGIDQPCLELVPLENMRIDPGASWVDPINSSPYVIRLIPMYLKDVKARTQQADARTGQPKWKAVTEAQMLAATKSYGDTTRATREGNRQDSQGQTSAINSFAKVWVHQNIMEIDGEDMVWYTLGDHALLSDPVPLKKMWWHGRRPFIMGMSVIETHKIYPAGPVGLTKDLQAETNEVANQRIDNVKLAMNKRWFAKRAGQVDIRSLVRGSAGSVTLMNDPEKDVKEVEFRDVTASSYQEHDRLNVEFDELAGNFSPSSVQSNRKLNETVGGMKVLDANGNQVSAYQLLTFITTWVQPVLEQLSLLETEYETDATIMRTAANMSGLWKMAKDKGYADKSIDAMLRECLAQDVNLTVEVGMGVTNPQEKVKNLMLGLTSIREILDGGVLERYGLDVADVIAEVFAALGYGTGKRFFDAGGDPALQAAHAQIDELTAQLAQKGDPPELTKAKVDKLTAEVAALQKRGEGEEAKRLETMMRAFFAAMQSSQVVGAAPQLAPVADAFLEAGGYKPPVPAGVDPNLPTLAGPVAGVTQDEITDPRTGIKYNPGAAGAPGDTSPLTPPNPALPASPVTGSEQGIDTKRSD